tara:strand:- start:476 stop:6979 length:6504 start_codon:yes stop_codon:yes gene_type:complete
MPKAREALKTALKLVAIMWLPAHAFKALGWITRVTPFLGMTAVTTFIGVLMGPGTPAVRNNFGTKVAVRSPTMGRGIVYGQARVQPLIAFVETTGTNNAIMHMVVVLAGHEIEELVSVSFNDTVLTSTTSTINGTTVHTVNNTRYVNTDNESNFGSGALIRYSFEDGSQTAANPFMVAQSSLTTDHKFLSCSYIYIQMAYDAEAFGGIPAMSAVIKGKKCYDPRTDTTTYTDNPALHIRDFISNTTYGLKAPTAEINDAATGGGFAAAANICDQLVTLDDSSTEKRFTSNGLTTMTANGTGVIQGLLSTMAGTLTYTNGQFGIFPGVAQTATLSITDDELLAPISIMTNDPQGAMFNEVKPIFIDSTQNYIPTDGPVYSSTTYLNQDTPTGASSTNYVKRLEQNFSFTTKATEAQRLARIHLNQSRSVTSLSCLVSLKYMQLQPNDWVQVTNERLSYTNKNFRVMAVELEMTEVEDVPVVVTRLELTEVDSSIYSFSGYEDMVDEGTGVDTGDNSVAAPSGLALSASLVVTGYELEATWTNNSSDIVQGTEVKFGTSSGNYIGSVVVGRGQNKAVIPSLTKNTTYYVAARHFSTNGVYSDLTGEVTLNTSSSSDINIPQVATSLSATTGKPLQIGVSWTAPTNSDIRAVKIYRRTSDTTPTDDTHLVDTITSEPGTSQKVTFGKEDGLSADTTYYFWLRSISFFGKESAFSSSTSGSFTDVTGTDISTSTKITAGTGNNVGVLDGEDSTYRIYAGHATPASAPFRVTQTGALTATSASIGGSVSTGTTFTAGTGTRTVRISGVSTDNITMAVGDATPTEAPFKIKSDGSVEIDNLKLYKSDGTLMFQSSTGFTTDAFSEIAADLGTAIDNYSTSKTNSNAANALKVTLKSTQTLTIKAKKNANMTGFSTASSTAAAQAIPEKVQMKLSYSTNSDLSSPTELAVLGTSFANGVTRNLGSADTSQYNVEITSYTEPGFEFHEASVNTTSSGSAVDTTTGQFIISDSRSYTGSASGTDYYFFVEVGGTAGTNTSGNNNVSDSAATRYIDIAGTSFYISDGDASDTGEGDITSVTAGTNLNGGGTSGAVTLNLDGTITGNHTFSNDVVIGGDLTVQGTTTTIDTTNLDVKDKNITLNYGSGDTSGNADGAGITIQDAVDASTNATLLWDQPNSKFTFSHPLTTLTVDDITIDGSTISDGGDLTFDLGGDMMIDVAGGDVRFKGSTSHPTATVGIMSFDSNDWVFKNNRSNYDIVFKGDDDGSTITALTLDMSDAGKATFNAGATFGDSVNISHGTPVLTLTDTSSSATTTITLDGINTTIDSNGTDGDIIFKGQDSSSEITALTLDMSDAGTATFNHDIKLGDGGQAIFGIPGSDLQIYHSGSHSFIDEQGTGGLIVRTGDFYLRNPSDQDMIYATSGGAVIIYHNNSAKLATSATGVTVTGALDATNLTIGSAQGSDGQVLTSTGSGVAWEDAGGSSQWTTTGSDIYYNTGKVLVGDTASHTADLLQIETPASGGGHGIQIRRNDSNTDQGIGSITFGNNTDTDIAQISAKTDGANDNGALLFSTQPDGGSLTERIRIDHDGKVGIGTDSPATKLHVMTASNGASTVGGASDELILENSSDCGLTIRSGSTSDGVISFADADDHNIGQIYYEHDVNAMVFRTYDSERMRIESGGDVAIGISDADSKLHTYQSAGNYIAHFESANANSYGVWIESGASANNGYPLLQVTSNGGSDTHFRVDSGTGYVGIGESSPDKQLHIKNTATGDTGIVIENTNNAQNLDIDFYSNGGSAQGRIRYEEGAGAFGFAPNVSASNALYIAWDGKTGIGTSSPDRKLHINESTASTSNFIHMTTAATGDSGSNGFLIGIGSDGNAEFWNYEAQPIIFATSSSERMRIDSSGNVSIGNSSVAFPSGEGLQVYSSGNPRIKLANSTTGVASGDGTQIYMDGADVIYDQKDSGNQRWYTGGSERMRMTSSGYTSMKVNSSTAYGSTTEPNGVLTLHNTNGTDDSGVNNFTTLEFNTADGATSQGFINYIRTGNNIGKFSFQQRTGSSSYAESLVIDNSGNATFQSNVTAYSDKRLKTDIKTLEGSKVLKMRGVSFIKDGVKGSGVIAQEIEEIAPELVITQDDEMGTKSVAYGNLTGYLIENAKRQEELIKELTKEINKLKKELT